MPHHVLIIEKCVPSPSGSLNNRVYSIWGVINAKHFRCDKQALVLGFKPTLFQC